ncbi:hypothetical protein FB45DRAFT_873011 [Roridomyces roridus]|uniref:Uncharacterized protein n=1 Tax=Roridomyces roridus TaxID=1738132 RepID=A0AAD7BBN1_9AGAR|nr:hypothetical protein FB45DRAFT_873011 [Roridomyces roridus]
MLLIFPLWLKRQREWNLGYLKSPMRKGSSGGPEGVLDHEGWWRIHGVLFKSSTGHLTEFLPYNPARPKHNQWNLANALANMDGWSNSKMFHLVFRLPIHVHGPVSPHVLASFFALMGSTGKGNVHCGVGTNALATGPWLNLLQIRVNMIQDQTYRLQITHLGTRIIQHQEISVFNHTAIVPLSIKATKMGWGYWDLNLRPWQKHIIRGELLERQVTHRLDNQYLEAVGSPLSYQAFHFSEAGVWKSIDAVVSVISGAIDGNLRY